MRRSVDDVDSRSGFSLIEALVALCLLSLTMVLLFSGLQFGVSTWSRTDRLNAQAEEVFEAGTLVRALLEKTYPAILRADGKSLGPTFKGEARRLEFTTTLPEALSAGGFHRVVLGLAQNGYAQDLRLVWRMEWNRPDEPPSLEDGAAVSLASGIREVQFSYFGQQPGEKSARWHERWADQERLPKLIRLDATLSNASAWPTLTVAPQIDVDATCVYDGLTQRCQGR